MDVEHDPSQRLPYSPTPDVRIAIALESIAKSLKKIDKSLQWISKAVLEADDNTSILQVMNLPEWEE